MAGKQNAKESRSAYAGGTLYDQLVRSQRARDACVRINAALEEFTPSKAEAGVILTSLKLLTPHVHSVALEDRFESLDPNDLSFFDDVGQNSAASQNEDIVDKIGRVGGNIINKAASAISSAASAIKNELQDFFDARIRWYGDLEKEVASLKADEEMLDGGPIVNEQIKSALAARPANKTFTSPSERANEVARESMRVMLLAEEIKADSAAVARAMASNKANLGSAVENLIRKIRSSAEQQGDNLIWNYPSFSAIMHASMPRGTDLESIVADDFKVNTIKVVDGKEPAIPNTLARATADDLQIARQVVRGGQLALNHAIQKNDKDILGTLANSHASEEGLTESQLNGVKSLIIFSNRIHESLALTAQQSYYNAVYLLVYWINSSVRDKKRTDSRTPVAE